MDTWLKTLSLFNKEIDKSEVLVSMEIIMKTFINNKKKVVLY
jgi:hypothetical protein